MSHKKNKHRASRKSKSSFMLMLLTLGGVVLLGLAAFLVWRGRAEPSPAFTPQVTGAPKLKADREAVDLGDVRLGQTVEVSFEIANTGDQLLRFTEAPYVEVAEGC